VVDFNQPVRSVACLSGEVADAFPPSVCSAPGTDTCVFTAPSENTQIQCEDPATDCTAGQSCCAYGGNLKADEGSSGVMCSFDKYVDWAGSKCASSCTGIDAGGTVLTLCAATTECATGQTCTAIKAKGISIGYCK
jgi:hypothetical protein